MELALTRLRSPIMMKNWIAIALVAAPLSAAAAVGPKSGVSFPSDVPYLPVPKSAAVILNTSSTNTRGYRVVVQRNGSAEYVTAASEPESAAVPVATVGKFFHDLQAAAPLQKLPHEPCMKSASFGTSFFVWWDHGRSPDLSCPSDSRGKAVFNDAMQIVQALRIPGMRRPVMRPLMPGEQHKPLPPSPSQSPSSM
jgi:hypothetical protein